MAWNAQQYEAGYSFVWQYGRDLLQLLGARPGERILDVGCGTGQLAAEIAAAGAEVVAIDSSPAMVEQARRNAPALRFEVQDVCDLPYRAEFDAVFSNAVLHWVRRAEDAAASMARALKPGGRLVMEMGGRGNVRQVLEASDRALRELGVEQPEQYHPWFYPSIAEYAAILEGCGLEVQFAVLFDRPTPLEHGLKGWFEMFGGKLVEGLDAGQLPEYYRLVEQYGPVDQADYRRLRIVAVRR
ncbi:MAG TPA: methyltransferase domain-containing protein [Candidatus Sulfopaludibacter sp.]|jgi:trans-aconitate 2-methyltransferase|nr:methyltransferase domain-containing protein [Candidatus Sulfopaludibacter sp.]